MHVSCLLKLQMSLLAGKRACVGYADGTVKLLDLKTGASIFTVAGGKSGHDAEVTCIDCHITDNVLVTGSVDCTAILINIGTGKVSSHLESLCPMCPCSAGKSRRLSRNPGKLDK